MSNNQKKKGMGHIIGQQKANKKQKVEATKRKLLRLQNTAERVKNYRVRTSAKLTATRYANTSELM